MKPPTKPMDLNQVKERLQFNASAVGLTRSECVKMCHDQTVARGGRYGDRRTRRYRELYRTLFQMCLQVQTPETRQRWIDEEIAEAATRSVRKVEQVTRKPKTQIISRRTARMARI